MWPFDKLSENRSNLTHKFDMGSALNTALNPFARVTGSYYVPKAFERFPTGADPRFNAALVQAGALGTTYAALAFLTRYITGTSQMEAKKRVADKQVKDRLGVEEDVIEGGMPKEAGVMGDFLSLTIPVAAMATAISGGYALASRKLQTDRAKELDHELAEEQHKLEAARERELAETNPLEKKAWGLPSKGTLTALAGLGLASVFASSAIISKKQFDSSDPARQDQKAADAAFKALTRARLAAADTDLHYVEKERAAKRIEGRKKPLELPEAPTSAAPATDVVRPYESVPV